MVRRPLHSYFFWGALIIAAVALIALQIHNVVFLPVLRGLDAITHIHYIEYLQKFHRVPMANDGWEMYQPPLYYFVGSLLPSLKLVQVMGMGSWFLLLTIAFLFLRHVFDDVKQAVIGTVLLDCLPVIIYLTPTITNEFFSGVVIMGAMAYYVGIFLPRVKSDSFLTQLGLGMLLGAALLSKATALILIITIVIERMWAERGRVIIVLRQLVIPLSIVVIISGWFYVRNVVYFHNPLVSSVDLFPIEQFGQRVVPRDFRFFTDLSGFRTFDLYYAQQYSFLAGTYFSWFYDGHNVIIPVQPFSKAGNLLIVLSAPLFFIAIKGYVAAWRVRAANDRFFLMYPILLISAYIAYNFRLPFYSTVKGLFLVSLALPFAYFFVRGLGKMRDKWLSAVAIYIALYAVIIAKHFWLSVWWYSQGR